MVDYLAPIAYKDAHRRLRRERGRAAEHECADCPEQARQWALLHDRPPQQSGLVQVVGRPQAYYLEWSGDPQDYEPLCLSCHIAKDEAYRLANGRPSRAAAKRVRRTHCGRGHDLTVEENVYVYVRGDHEDRRCRACERNRRAAKKQAA